jgi:hypothetical protein
LNRRDFINAIASSAVALPLVGCGDTSVTRRIKIIATAEVNGKQVQGATVMELKWRGTSDGRMYQSELGEALILELAGRGTVYVLNHTMTPDGDTSSGIYVSNVNQAVGVKYSTAMAAELPLLEAASGRFPIKPYHRRKLLPLMVAFKDETRKDSVYEVRAENFSKHFGAGVKFIGLEFEFTDEPVTADLKKRFPMLASHIPGNEFPRDPPGNLTRYSTRPFAKKMSENMFFGFGDY